MTPDITESGSFEITESMPSPGKTKKELIKPKSATGIMKKILKFLLYALFMILTAAYIGGMAFLLDEKSIYGIVMAAIAVLAVAYVIARDKGGEVE